MLTFPVQKTNTTQSTYQNINIFYFGEKVMKSEVYAFTIKSTIRAHSRFSQDDGNSQAKHGTTFWDVCVLEIIAISLLHNKAV